MKSNSPDPQTTAPKRTKTNHRRRTPEGTQYPVLCNLTIAPGWSEYVVRNGFKVHIGRDRHVSAKCYLPYSWIHQRILFAVQEDGEMSDPTDCTIRTPAGQHTDEALHSITPEMSRRDKRMETKLPFINVGDHVEFLSKVVRQEKIYSRDDKPGRYTGAVYLPPEWIGRNIVCIRTYAPGEIPKQAKERYFHDLQLITLGHKLRMSQKNMYCLLNERRIEY